jgi:hypothetical protein
MRGELAAVQPAVAAALHATFATLSPALACIACICVHAVRCCSSLVIYSIVSCKTRTHTSGNMQHAHHSRAAYVLTAVCLAKIRADTGETNKARILQQTAESEKLLTTTKKSLTMRMTSSQKGARE